MWRLKYLVCLITSHDWVGYNYHYCLRCGKLELGARCGQDPTVR